MSTSARTLKAKQTSFASCYHSCICFTTCLFIFLVLYLCEFYARYELRPAIIRAHENGKGVCEIARFLDIEPSTVSRTIKRFKKPEATSTFHEPTMLLATMSGLFNRTGPQDTKQSRPKISFVRIALISYRSIPIGATTTVNGHQTHQI